MHMLPNFMSTRHKLDLYKKMQPQMQKWLKKSGYMAFYKLVIDVGRPIPRCWFYKKAV